MTDTDRVTLLARLVARHGAITLRAGRNSTACTAEDVLLEKFPLSRNCWCWSCIKNFRGELDVYLEAHPEPHYVSPSKVEVGADHATQFGLGSYLHKLNLAEVESATLRGRVMHLEKCLSEARDQIKNLSNLALARMDVIDALRKEQSEYMKRNAWVEREEHFKVLNEKAELERKHIVLMEIAHKRLDEIRHFQTVIEKIEETHFLVVVEKIEEAIKSIKV